MSRSIHPWSFSSTAPCVWPSPANATSPMPRPGDCSQACRLPYTLKDEQGGVIAYEKHLLSMKDNNQSANLRALVDAGIRSFKIEGRYKDMGYVKNITAYYRQRLDEILADRP